MVTKDAWDRYQIIDKKLRHGRKHTVKQIIRSIENSLGPISDKQVRLDFIRMTEVYGAKIIKGGQHTFTYEDLNFTISSFPINEEDEEVLNLVSMTLQTLNSTNIKQKYNSVIDKIFKGIDTTYKLANTDNINIIQPQVSYGYTGYQWIEPIFKSILNKVPVEIIYQKQGDDPKRKLISAYILKEFRNHWYLIGFDHLESKLTKVYALDRINDILVSKEKYFIDPNFDSTAYFKYSFGIFHNYFEKPIKLVLEFYGFYIQEIINHPLMATQKYKLNTKGNILKVELELYDSPEIIRELLSYGSNVKVISPKSLRDKLKTISKSINSLY